MTFLLICVISVFLGKGIKTEVLILPVTNLFAFTQLRSTMPGAPSGFGEPFFICDPPRVGVELAFQAQTSVCHDPDFQLAPNTNPSNYRFHWGAPLSCAVDLFGPLAITELVCYGADIVPHQSVFMCAVFLFRDPEEHARRWIQRHPEAAQFAHEKPRSATV